MDVLIWNKANLLPTAGINVKVICMLAFMIHGSEVT